VQSVRIITFGVLIAVWLR